MTSPNHASHPLRLSSIENDTERMRAQVCICLLRPSDAFTVGDVETCTSGCRYFNMNPKFSTSSQLSGHQKGCVASCGHTSTCYSHLPCVKMAFCCAVRIPPKPDVQNICMQRTPPPPLKTLDDSWHINPQLQTHESRRFKKSLSLPAEKLFHSTHVPLHIAFDESWHLNLWFLFSQLPLITCELRCPRRRG